MKKPKWAIRKNLRYKVVTLDYMSIYPVMERIPGACILGPLQFPGIKAYGEMLSYRQNTLVVSRNGVCHLHECCRGIHALRGLKKARQIAQNEVSFGTPPVRIIRVYALKWYGKDNKVRAERVWVGKEVLIPPKPSIAIDIGGR